MQNTPLHPIAEWGRQRFGGADLSAERRLAELESPLAQVKIDPKEIAPLLAPLLDIPLPVGRAPTLAPEELRRRQLAALTNWVIAGAKVQPVVLAFEDLHWADPTTLDVLRVIAERGAQAPLFVLATARPEFRPPWSMRSHHGTISLAPLDRSQVRDMVAELSARHALSREVVDDVAARTGGVPLAGTARGCAARPSVLVEAAAERRHLTVMFCDLVGSTAISAQLDAEEWRDLVGAYLDAASAAVTEMGGHVAKKLGDGLMSLFGYPVAQENDSERAVRAALSVQRALAELNRKNDGSGRA